MLKIDSLNTDNWGFSLSCLENQFLFIQMCWQKFKITVEALHQLISLLQHTQGHKEFSYHAVSLRWKPHISTMLTFQNVGKKTTFSLSCVKFKLSVFGFKYVRDAKNHKAPHFSQHIWHGRISYWTHCDTLSGSWIITWLSFQCMLSL